MPGDFRWLAVNTRVHTYYHSAHEAAGASGARHSPRPLFSGRMLLANLGRIAPRECEGVSGFAVIASAAKKSTLSLLRYGLLRGACHRARIRATRWLAACRATTVK